MPTAAVRSHGHGPVRVRGDTVARVNVSRTPGGNRMMSAQMPMGRPIRLQATMDKMAAAMAQAWLRSRSI